MLRAMILIVLAIALAVTILTQIILPMFIEQLSFFWYFKKLGRDDIITNESECDEPSLYSKAYEAKKNYKTVKKEIKEQKDKLDRLDKATDV